MVRKENVNILQRLVMMKVPQTMVRKENVSILQRNVSLMVTSTMSKVIPSQDGRLDLAENSMRVVMLQEATSTILTLTSQTTTDTTVLMNIVEESISAMKRTDRITMSVKY
jgi:hypothetical protein